MKLHSHYIPLVAALMLASCTHYHAGGEKVKFLSADGTIKEIPSKDLWMLDPETGKATRFDDLDWASSSIETWEYDPETGKSK